MFLAAVLFLGILTMWVPARWALTGFQVAIFALAGWRIAARIRGDRALHVHPITWLLGAATAWGLLQAAAGWTVDQYRTLDQVLNWITNTAAFALAVEAAAEPRTRERFLDATLLFALALSVLGMLTVFSSPPGLIAWRFDVGTDLPTLGPFVYRNQYAAFIEAILPLAIVRALIDRQRGLLYVSASAVLFASVVAGASRTGTILCLVEILLLPVLAFARGIVSGRRLARVMLGSAAIVATLAVVAGWDFVWNRLQEPHPYALRANLVRSSVDMLADRPLTGFGLGTWPQAYPGYALFDDGLFVNQAHNDWAQWAVEGGIPFFVLMLAAATWAVRPALRSLWGVGILAVFLHCLVDYPMQQRPALAAFFFAMLGMTVAGGDRKDP